VLVSNKLAGRRIGILALGGLPGGLSTDIEDALQPTGGSLVAVGVIREPPDIEALSDELSETRFADISSNPDTVQALGSGFGRQLVIGGNLVEKVGSKMFSRVSGRFGDLDGLVIVREVPHSLNNVEEESVSRLESGLLDGVSGTAVNAVGVEASDAEPSSISFFEEHNLSTVDDIDLASGKVAAVFALLGAEGSFGIKGSADRLLPDLLAPGPVVPAPTPKQGGNRGASAAAGSGGSGAGQGK
jgi:hypothetical protein